MISASWAALETGVTPLLSPLLTPLLCHDCMVDCMVWRTVVK